ncbi:MCE family protein [Planctomycetales bacterium ZRK34]|nr:MCE family protein [Planctomycetales bacterium ZRK34]
MKERTRNTIVGFTALAGLIAVAWMAFMFGELEEWTADTYPVTVELNNATGITAGSRIKLSGIDVGFVEALDFADGTATRVVMNCRIDSKYDIPANATVTSTGSLLGGASTLAITPAMDEQGNVIPSDGKHVPRDGSGNIKGTVVSMSQQFTEIARDLRDQLRPQLKNFGKVSERIIALADEYKAVGEKLNAMLEKRSIADVDAGKVDANFTTVVARVDSRLAELRETLDRINKVVGDEKLLGDIRATATNARELTADARTKLDALTTRYVALADDLSKSLSSMDKLLVDARTGKGTLGRVMQDPALYNNLTDAAARLNEALKQAQLLIEKWKAEGLPVQF